MKPSIYLIKNVNFSLRHLTALSLFTFLTISQVAFGQSTIAQQDFDGGTPSLFGIVIPNKMACGFQVRDKKLLDDKSSRARSSSCLKVDSRFISTKL